MSASTPEATVAPPGNPFPYGWRYVERTAPDGSMTFEQVPLTLEADDAAAAGLPAHADGLCRAAAG